MKTIEDRVGPGAKPSHLTEEQHAGIVAAMSGLDDTMAQVEKLTEKQRSRALATVAGKTPSEIAQAEGVSSQAVTETLRSREVRATVQFLIGRTKMRLRGSDQEPKLMIMCAVEMLGALLYAEKPFGCEGGFKMVPDNATRLAAVTKIMALYQEPLSAASLPAQLRPLLEDPPQELVEEIAVETSSTKRVSRRRSAS